MTASLIGGDEISMEGFFLLHAGVTIIIFTMLLNLERLKMPRLANL
ncbi:hypothetical protein HXA35_04430 [Bacillus sp. A301a_S52]|nr:hypothetical protein [Bacillus sp. A301a_S52]